jgi:hypothetical protein
MLDYSSLLQTGSLGLGGAIITGLMSFKANADNQNHEYRMKSLDVASKNFDKQIQDTQQARNIPFKFTRRLMVIALFVFMPMLMGIIAAIHLPISVPVKQNNSYLFGFYHTIRTAYITIQGYPYLSQTISDLMSLMGGFYFGCSFKNN